MRQTRFNLTPALVILGALSFLSLTPTLAQAQLRETWYFQGAPSESQIAAWSNHTSLAGERIRYLLDMDDPIAPELSRLKGLTNAKELLIETRQYPAESERQEWQALNASLKTETTLIVMRGDGPTDDEVRRLNDFNFRSIVIVFTYYPGEVEAKKLSRIQSKLQITFATSAYPKFEDRKGLQALDPAIPVLYTSQYWPHYIHMDVLNLTPQKDIKLRVIDTLPAEENLPYINHIKNLTQIAMQTTHESFAPSTWASFRSEVDLTWMASGFFPSLAKVNEFAATLNGTEKRAIKIDCDQDIEPGYRIALKNLTLSIDWTHTAPYSDRMNSQRDSDFKRNLGNQVLR